MATHSVATKLNVSGAGGDALERFCKMYNSRTGGKSALVNDLLAGGLMLKETGILDLVLNLDEDSNYRELSNKEKTRVLISELAELFGSVDTDKQPKTTTVESKQEIETQPVIESVEEKQPVKKAKLPDLGL
ncbi:hypothetical protein I3271_05565 [Photobacterium leiognathi]|uniref:hypothetical protein n=1 Tax=Photobacterium leiognathi TaxID=553611 RepID=UPI001EE0092A|nr:hypothetical protein [Photobacterium leiognathi]MCG3884149.1 hypothetical protein [Photobacterium leiognathi]